MEIRGELCLPCNGPASSQSVGTVTCESKPAFADAMQAA